VATWPERRHSPWPEGTRFTGPVLALLERHRVSRRGRVLTPDHVERAVSLYSTGRSCTSIGKELQVNPETIRQALLKAGMAMRRPGRPRTMEP